jgi:rare lipoprotein A
MMKSTRNLKSVALAIASVIHLTGCATTGTATTKTAPHDPETGYMVKSIEHGKASWYSVRTNRGTKTASGERLNERAATAAHKTLPMGTKVRVANLANGKSEVVRINDRGPFIRGRVIDVTVGSAERLGFVKRGVVPVKVEVLAKPKSDNE